MPIENCKQLICQLYRESKHGKEGHAVCKVMMILEKDRSIYYRKGISILSRF